MRASDVSGVRSARRGGRRDFVRVLDGSHVLRRSGPHRGVGPHPSRPPTHDASPAVDVTVRTCWKRELAEAEAKQPTVVGCVGESRRHDVWLGIKCAVALGFNEIDEIGVQGHDVLEAVLLS